MIRTPPTRPTRPHPAASATTHPNGDVNARLEAMVEKTNELKLQTLSSEEESVDAVDDVTEISTQQPPLESSYEPSVNASTVNFDALKKNNVPLPCSFVTASTEVSSFRSAEYDFTKGIDIDRVERDYHDMERNVHKIASATTYIAGKVTETKATTDQIRETQLEEKEQSSTRHDEIAKKQDETIETTQQLRGEHASGVRTLLDGQAESTETIEKAIEKGVARIVTKMEEQVEKKEKAKLLSKAKSAVGRLDRFRGNGGN